MDSLLVAHVGDEAKSFVPCYVTNEANFSTFLGHSLPGNQYTDQRAQIVAKYGAESNTCVRAESVIGDSSFDCNTRVIFDAYHTYSDVSVYMMQYDVFHLLKHNALHATDLFPTFYNDDIDKDAVAQIIQDATDLSNKTIQWYINSFLPAQAAIYQTYLTNFAIKGSPKANSSVFVWETAYNISGEVHNVMEAALGLDGIHLVPKFTFHTVDSENTDESCSFWGNMSQ